jgi:hypothetical protein
MVSCVPSCCNPLRAGSAEKMDAYGVTSSPHIAYLRRFALLAAVSSSCLCDGDAFPIVRLGFLCFPVSGKPEMRLLCFPLRFRNTLSWCFKLLVQHCLLTLSGGWGCFRQPEMRLLVLSAEV